MQIDTICILGPAPNLKGQLGPNRLWSGNGSGFSNFNLNGLEVHQQSGECSNLKMVTGPSYSRSLGSSESDSGPRTVTRAVTEIIEPAAAKSKSNYVLLWQVI